MGKNNNPCNVLSNQDFLCIVLTVGLYYLTIFFPLSLSSHLAALTPLHPILIFCIFGEPACLLLIFTSFWYATPGPVMIINAFTIAYQHPTFPPSLANTTTRFINTANMIAPLMVCFIYFHIGLIPSHFLIFA